MSERTEGDGPPEGVPDWFDAGTVEDEDGPDTDGNGRSGGAGTGNWFDDPDHRPIRTGTESADTADSGIPDPGDTAEDEAGGATARGATEDGPTVEEEDGPTVEEEDGPTVEEEDGPGVRTESGPPVEEADEEEPTAGDPARSTTTAGEAPGSTDEDRSGPRDSEPASAARERTPAPGEGGSADDEQDAATAASTLEESGTDATDDADDTGSSIRRLVAWLRSVFGRLS